MSLERDIRVSGKLRPWMDVAYLAFLNQAPGSFGAEYNKV